MITDVLPVRSDTLPPRSVMNNNRQYYKIRFSFEGKDYYTLSHFHKYKINRLKTLIPVFNIDVSLDKVRIVYDRVWKGHVKLRSIDSDVCLLAEVLL